MLTQLLRESGCKLPVELVGPNITNPDGHFEDYRVIRFHDYLLAKASSSWQFCGKADMLPGSGHEFDALIEHLSVNLKADDTLLIKDPRICLFLNQWQHKLQADARYVFVARHWLYSIESLLSRHSIRIAESIKTGQLGRHFNFWLDPTLAARMWLSYNSSLLDFKRNHGGKVIFYTQQGLSDLASLTDGLRLIGVDCDAGGLNSHDPKKFKSSVSARILELIPIELQNALDLLWREILMEVDGRSDSEEPMFYQPDNVDLNYHTDTLLENKLEWQQPEVKAQAEAPVYPELTPIKLELEQTAQLLREQPDSAELLMKKSELLVRLNCVEMATDALQKLVKLVPNHPRARIKLFELLDANCGYSQARDAYLSAVKDGVPTVAQIEHRIQLRDDFANTKADYFSKLKNMTTLNEKQQFVCKLMEQIADPTAQQDLNERLWKIWA